jgi:hypothetical protein
MHTFEADSGTRIHYNSDYSGDVIITTVTDRIELPCKDILDFVASYIRANRIDAVANLSTEDLLK